MKTPAFITPRPRPRGPKKRSQMTGGVRAIFCLLGALASPVSAEILTLYSDLGVPASSAAVPVIAYAGLNPCFSCGWNGNSTVVVPPEGYTSFASTATLNVLWLGWGFDYGATNIQNLSRFSSGFFRFWINTTTGNLKVEIKDAGGQVTFIKQLDVDLGWTSALANQWVQYNIPFSGNLRGTGLSAVQYPYLFTAMTLPGTFYVDNVRYVDSAVSSPYFNAVLKNRSDGLTVSSLTWSSVNLPARWVLADQYIELSLDSNVPAWGVQIYTDNTASGALPRYVNTSTTTDPSGLLDAGPQGNDPTSVLRLPLTWSIVDVSSPTLTAVDPDDGANNLSFLWFYMQDRMTPQIGSGSAFQNGSPYATVKGNCGIHYTQGDPLLGACDPAQFGAANPPDYIYLGADFGNALAPRIYKTSTLRLEYYTP